MSNKEIILITLSILVALVNGHGYLFNPVSRAFYQSLYNRTRWPGSEMSGGLVYRYYYRGGDIHVCGNNGWSGYAQNTQLTGPVQKTYLSGTKATMNAFFVAAHGGYFNIKLCKLKSSSDIVSQECFDQEALKIVATDGYETASILDGYNVHMPYLGEDNRRSINFTVQLPEGLTCENCVLLWEWRQPPRQKKCQYSNGSMISDELLPYSCISQTFRSCADIKIVSNPNQVSSVYVPNPFKQVKESNDKIFQCLNYHEHTDQAKLVPFQSPNTRPDPHKFTGAGLYCVIEDTKNCNACLRNCMTPDKVCPEFCYCRWYPKKINVYQIPMSPDGWNS
jgi:hypothetical protein